MTHITTRRPRRAFAAAATTAALTAAAVAAPAATATADPSECMQAAGAWQITADCIDPLFGTPVIDSVTDETSPATHRRVSGHFDGTAGAYLGGAIKFEIYLPPADDFERRFFQYTYPLTGATADDRAIGFALESGGYAVQAGNSSTFLGFPLSLGYRHAAAAAKFAEAYAADYYGVDDDIYGYLYGPSGGSYQTTGAAENTTGVWDGFAPLVQGVPMSSPYTFVIRSAAELILGDKADQIRDAVLPGGSGDPYAGLDAGEAAMLRELVNFGVPLRAWEFSDYVLGYADQFAPGGLGGFIPDATYVEDFWSADGYLGTEDSPLGDAVRAALAEMGDTADNREDIAGRFSYRHQVPVDDGYAGFAQFIGQDGSALYPQRLPIQGPLSTRGVSGNAAFDGSINGKMIVVDNLYDTDALPYHADWYAQRVESSLGSAAFADSYRLYYNDHADHQDRPVGTGVDPERAQHLVDWYGMVEQALRDLSAWVEDGVEPPRSTRYEIADAQVVVADNAAVRRGIQPTVDLTVNGSDSVTVKAGASVALKAKVQTPPDGGVIVGAEWDLDGDGVYEDAGLTRTGTVVNVRTSATFDEPGEYLVALKVTSAREGHEDDTYARVQNLDRVRVIVTE